MAGYGAVEMKPIGDGPYTDRTYNKFCAKPLSPIESVPSEGYVGALAKNTLVRSLQEVLAEIIGVPAASLALAYEGKDLDLSLTLSDNGINEPGPAARRAGTRINLDFLLVDDAVPSSVLRTRARLKAEDVAKQDEVDRLELKRKQDQLEEEERIRLLNLTEKDREAQRKRKEEEEALRAQRRPPNPTGIIRFRCISGFDDDASGVSVETHSSCQCGQLAQRLLDHFRQTGVAGKLPDGIALVLKEQKLRSVGQAEELELRGKQELGDAGFENGTIAKFSFTDASESIDLLPCTQLIAMDGFENSEGATQTDTAACSKAVLDDFGRTSGWTLAPSAEEKNELRSLKICQLEGLTYIRNLCKHQHMDALQDLEKRAASLGYDELDFVKTLEWVRELAPIIIHVDLAGDKGVGAQLAKDTHYRNQFETMKSKGTYNHSHRSSVENKLFGMAYEAATGFDRVKYGTLNFSNNPRGVESAYHYGKDYFVLKRVRLRTTLTSQDSFSLSALGTPDYYAHILSAYGDDELKAALSMGKHKRATEEFKQIIRGQYKEAQFHGEIRLQDHIDKIVVHESRRIEGEAFLKQLEDLRAACGNCDVFWMDSPEDMEKVTTIPKSLREIQYEDTS